eukprot:364078-Chlamydomonas_euryale.AAC.1
MPPNKAPPRPTAFQLPKVDGMPSCGCVDCRVRMAAAATKAYHCQTSGISDSPPRAAMPGHLVTPPPPHTHTQGTHPYSSTGRIVESATGSHWPSESSARPAESSLMAQSVKRGRAGAAHAPAAPLRAAPLQAAPLRAAPVQAAPFRAAPLRAAPASAVPHRQPAAICARDNPRGDEAPAALARRGHAWATRMLHPHIRLGMLEQHPRRRGGCATAESRATGSQVSPEHCRRPG